MLVGELSRVTVQDCSVLQADLLQHKCDVDTLMLLMLQYIYVYIAYL